MTQDFIDAYERDVERVYRYLAFRTGSRSDAEDLTQATFERAFRAWDRFDPRKASSTTWLLAIARNAFLDHHRRHRSEAQAVAALKEEAPGYASGPEELGMEWRLAASIRSLSERERSVLALRFGGELAAAEIGRLLNLSTDNVHQITSRALRKLRARLEGEWADAPEGLKTSGAG
jgi:RNA polymerase sigma factor (sigma-70 family)